MYGFLTFMSVSSSMARTVPSLKRSR